MSPRNRLDQLEEGTRVRPQRAKTLPLPATQPRQLMYAGVVAVIVVVTFLGPQYLSVNGVNLCISMFCLMIVAQSWNLIGGYGGQFAMGHAMFVGIGSYGTALILLHSSVPVVWAVLFSGLMAAAIAAIVAVPSLRMRGISFSIATLAFALASQYWMTVWEFGGRAMGVNVPWLKVGANTQYYAALGVIVVQSAGVAVLVKTRLGLRLMAVRDDEDAAKQVGVNTTFTKFWAFVVSGFFAGIGGALVFVHNLNVEPLSGFDFGIAVSAILACVVGGMSTAAGPLIGIGIVFAIQQTFKTYGEYDKIILGLVMLAVIMLAPEGVWGLLRRSTSFAVNLGGRKRDALPANEDGPSAGD